LAYNLTPKTNQVGQFSTPPATQKQPLLPTPPSAVITQKTPTLATPVLGFSNVQKQANTPLMQPSPMFGSQSQNVSHDDDAEGVPDTDYDPIPEFKPIVTLPEVEVSTLCGFFRIFSC